MQILVFGESTVWGAWDERGGWVQRLREFVEEKHGRDPETCHLVYNLGVSGNTSTRLLERFEAETKWRFEDEESTDPAFIFQFGVNDAGFAIPESVFEANAQKLITLAKRYRNRILFVGLHPVDESKTLPVHWDTNSYYRNNDLKRNNIVLKEVCAKNDVPFVDPFDKFTDNDISEDGVHLNSKGHQKIFEAVRDALEKQKLV